MIKLENEQFLVEISEKGAELQKIFSKENQIDYLWDGTPEVWAKHAPVLFPSIGKSNNDQYTHKGTTYDMPHHGFAGEFDFTVLENSATSVTLSLCDNDSTFSRFPFHFELILRYSLTNTGLATHYTVKNLTDEVMSFSLGAHPGFQVPLGNDGNFEDYVVSFEPTTVVLKRFEFVMTPMPHRSGVSLTFDACVDGKIALTRDIFENGLIVFDNPEIKSVTLSSPKSAHSVTVDTTDFPYFCLWTQTSDKANFVCLEPFYGIPDIYEKSAELIVKDGNCILVPNSQKEFHTVFSFK
ncbi:aldose 1-epimerase [Lactococcus hodotermopsidis]|uniref:Aldose 1-epimerase n=1 Tax=Pseudolactococcus hodotermopsidis TaxID=2709157 RepID=A0A6A0BDN3_9LACT|nr:aldose 1-epimerase family protein [Lactococcus hodotermopsidis]GFH41937.1 aldose 1-epimerase [Lactococcus hodotermopsidis]